MKCSMFIIITFLLIVLIQELKIAKNNIEQLSVTPAAEYIIIIIIIYNICIAPYNTIL